MPERAKPPTPRDEALEALKQAVYFTHQAHWLHSRFADGLFENVPGLCKSVKLNEIAANDYSLTPGRYVGVAAGGDEDEEDFVEQMREIHNELEVLNERAQQFATRISQNLTALLL